MTDGSEIPVSSRAPVNLTDDELTQEMTRLTMAAQDLIGDAWCNGSDDCRTMGWGAKPCGGPSMYLVYSSTETSTAQLQAIADRFHDLGAEYNRRKGLISDCALTPRPDVDCVNGRCADVDETIAD